MSRYIDVDTLKNKTTRVNHIWNGTTNAEGKGLDEIIDDIPTADVVEVVRCKDCKHKPNGYTDNDVLRYPNFPHEENNPCPCHVYEDEWYSWIPNDDFYCSYGER